MTALLSLILKQETLSCKELEYLLNTSRTSIWKWRRKGMPYEQIEGSRPEFNKEEVFNWIKAQPNMHEFKLRIMKLEKRTFNSPT